MAKWLWIGIGVVLLAIGTAGYVLNSGAQRHRRACARHCYPQRLLTPILWLTRTLRRCGPPS